MAKDKLSANPAQVQRKKEKEKAFKKAKLEKSTRRTEKLARRNPDRLQRQIDDLKTLAEIAPLNVRDKRALEELERDLAAVRKAREALGEAAPKLESRAPRGDRESGGPRGNRGGGQGFRRKREDDSDETDEDVRWIPMPRDTPPPIPPEFPFKNRRGGINANMTPLGASRMETGPHPLPAKPETPVAEQPKVVYKSAPQIRDLRKEATKFMPVAVQRKIAAVKGGGRHLGEKEVEGLEGEGYIATSVKTEGVNAAPAVSSRSSPISISITTAILDRRVKVEDEVEHGDVDVDMRGLEEEEERFRREVTGTASKGKVKAEDIDVKMEGFGDANMKTLEALLQERERLRLQVVNLAGEIVWNKEAKSRRQPTEEAIATRAQLIDRESLVQQVADRGGQILWNEDEEEFEFRRMTIAKEIKVRAWLKGRETLARQVAERGGKIVWGKTEKEKVKKMGRAQKERRFLIRSWGGRVEEVESEEQWRKAVEEDEKKERARIKKVRRLRRICYDHGAVSTGEDEVMRDDFRQSKKDQKVRRKLIQEWGGKVPKDDGPSSEEDPGRVKRDREYCVERRRRGKEAMRLGMRYKSPRWDDSPERDPTYDKTTGERGDVPRSSLSPSLAE